MTDDLADSLALAAIVLGAVEVAPSGYECRVCAGSQSFASRSRPTPRACGTAITFPGARSTRERRSDRAPRAAARVCGSHPPAATAATGIGRHGASSTYYAHQLPRKDSAMTEPNRPAFQRLNQLLQQHRHEGDTILGQARAWMGDDERAELDLLAEVLFPGSTIEVAYDPDTGVACGAAEIAERELGPFSMDELVSYRGRFGLPIERDLHYKPVSLAAIVGDV
jgi:hypothetical protein